MSGDPQKGIEYTTNALRLSPRDPSRHLILNVLGWAHFAAGDYAQGTDCAQRAIGEAPSMPPPHLCLVVNWIGMAEIARAKTEFQVLRTLAPELVETRLAGQWLSSNPEFRRRATTFLRIAAGLEDPSAAEALR
jgi:tetratricopeptide (TPR) repeat protein